MQVSSSKDGAKHLWLVASVVFFLLGVIGIISLVKEESASQPVANVTPTPVVPIARSPEPEKQKPPPEQYEPPPEPERPKPSVKQIESDVWRATLPITYEWFDTGIPVPVNGSVMITVEKCDYCPKGKWLTKLAGKTFLVEEDISGRFYCSVGASETTDSDRYYLVKVPLDFCGTISLKTDDELPQDSLQLNVKLYDNFHKEHCPAYIGNYISESHKAAHMQAREKAAALRRRIARR